VVFGYENFRVNIMYAGIYSGACLRIEDPKAKFNLTVEAENIAKTHDNFFYYWYDSFLRRGGEDA